MFAYGYDKPLIERFTAKNLLLVFYRSLLPSLYLGAEIVYDSELKETLWPHIKVTRLTERLFQA